MFGLSPFGSYLVRTLLQNLLNGIINNLAIPQTIQTGPGIINSEIKETPDSYIIQAVLPGVTKDSINIKYIDNYLTLNVKSNQYLKNWYGGYTRYIRNSSKTYYLDDIDCEKIDGSFNNNVLRLVLPKIKK